MAPLPPNSTARFNVNYTSGGNQHSFQLRSTASPAAVGFVVDNFLNALSTAIFQVVIDNVDFAAIGSNVFNPVVTGIEGNIYSAGIPAGENRAWALNFIGRTSGGRRVRLMLFGPTLLTTDYRYIAGEAGFIDAGRASLVAAGGQILGIDGLTPVWKTYVNTLANAYWQKELRP